MDFNVIPKMALAEWVACLGQEYRLVGPTAHQGGYVFAEVRSAEEIEWDYPTSILPPKKALLPQRERLLRFDLGHNCIETVFDDRPTVLLGVHTCDLHAICLLDAAFGADVPDQHYLRRRENVTIVSIECLSPCNEHSFCKDMGTLNVPERYDLHLTDLGDVYAADAGSERGYALLKMFQRGRAVTEMDARRFRRVMSGKWARFQYRLQADVSELPSLVMINYKSALWAELEKTCVGCGVCNLVCPTCCCFDVQDEVDLSLQVGGRFRVWDSCQLDHFASVAGGHDFRPGRGNRLRHRFLRKFRYQSVAPGLTGCVGCGRCAQACLVGISPVEVLNKLHQRLVASTHGRQEVKLK